MSTDNSAVSDLIRQMNTRRLRTDPGTAFLFQPSDAPARRARPSLGFERPFESPSRSGTASVAARPRAPERSHAWRWILAAIVVGGLAMGVAAFGPFRASHEESAAALDLQPQPARAVVAPVAVPVVAPPSVAPSVEPTVTPTIVPTITPTIAPATTPTITPTIAPASDAAPAAEAPAALAVKPARHRAAGKKHALGKQAPAKPAIAKQAKPVATPAATPDAEAPPVTPRHAAKPSAQSMDTENPL